MIRCFVPRSWIKSPRMTVTAPFAKPTATCDKSSVAAKADICDDPSVPYPLQTQPSLPPKPTGNGFFPLFTATVLKHVGIPVFLTGLSSAHTFSSGSPAPSYTRSAHHPHPLSPPGQQRNLPRQ